MIQILGDISRWECVYGECKAKCCVEGVELTLSDIKRISSLGMRWDEFAEYDEDTKTFRLRGVNGRCIFVDDDLKCKIREKEPVACRLLPFKIMDVRYSDEPMMKLRPVIDCPGEGVGREFDEEAVAQIERDALSLLRENQELIRRVRSEGIEAILKELSPEGQAP